MPELMPDTIPELLERIQALAKAKVERSVAFESDRPELTFRHKLNPSFVPLLALVQEECHGCCGGGLGSHVHCGDDCTDGFVLRTAYWQAAANGELEGALVKVVATMPDEKSTRYLWLALYEFLRTTKDNRIPALQAVVRWLEAIP